MKTNPYNKDNRREAQLARSTPLGKAVYDLNGVTKQAMYAAIIRVGTIKRSTWDGCAFNAAGEELGYGYDVNSANAAADATGLDISAVHNFIDTWDDLEGTDEECTKILLELLEKVGLFDDEPRTMVRVFDEQEDAAILELRREIEEGVFFEGASEVENLLRELELV